MYVPGRDGKEGENRPRRIVIRSSGCSPHMRSVPLITKTRTIVEDIGHPPIVSSAKTPASAAASFCKDGRKISVGDCALFKPLQDSPPFIGLIRSLTYCKENNLQLGVNWLYRPPEVKLGKGILLEAAPNELFYSFHKDEIPAASLLHPCKVAFLPKGVELPTGISSFVCRRVYDIATNCLWWLTDQDYIDERQEEVDKLLDKTRIEMDAVLHPGGRSPKPTIAVATSHLKPGSDNLQNTASSLPSQTKGKKRERGDHLTDPVKRERLLKTDDTDSGMFRGENSLKSEIAKITEKGGLVDSESVQRLVQLMQPDRTEKKIDLISRSMLAGVIAATDKFDCLSRFVQLKGLPVLDEWLHDVQKRKIADISSSKDGDKSSEEFLLVLLRALDKLPVNLNALQTSNIGRSVNHLRSHKNLEIQKKARSLVDTWKKRVEAEMNVIDAKSASTQAASWSTKGRLPEGHGARNSAGSGDIALKSSVTQLSASKLVSVKGSQGETATKSLSSSPGSIKSATSPASGKEGHLRTTAGGTSDVPLSMREDKSSSSSQSHNCNQSFLGKEDARSSTTGSMTVGKISSGSSRHRRSTSSFPGASVSGIPKETGSSRNACTGRDSTQEKVSQSAVVGVKTTDFPATDGISHKLIVKIPTCSRSPAQSKGEGSSDGPSIMSSRASSPVLSDRHEQSDSNSKEKCDTSHATVTPEFNAESWQSNDTKDLQTASDEGDGSLAGLPEEEHSRTVGNNGKTCEVSKVASSSSRNDVKSGLCESSFNSMYALIESCAKYAESSPSTSVRDDIGMNLLASVAAGEMCKSELISTTDVPQGGTPPVEEGNDAKSKTSTCQNYEQGRYQTSGTRGGVEHTIPAIGTWSNDGTPLTKHSPTDSSGDGKPSSSFSEERFAAPVHDNSVVTAKSDDTAHSNSASDNRVVVKERDGDESKGLNNAGVFDAAKTESVPHAKLQTTDSLLTETFANNGFSTEDLKEKMKTSLSIPLKESESKKEAEENLTAVADVEQKPTLMAVGKERQPASSCNDLAVPGNLNEGNVGEADQEHSMSFNQSVGQKFENKTCKGSASDDQSSSSDNKIDLEKTNVQNKTSESCTTASSTQEKSSAYPSQDRERDGDLKESKLSDAETDKTEDCSSTVADTTVSAGAPTMNPKMKFDLNEGLNGDDGKFGEPINLSASGCSSSVYAVNTLSSYAPSSAGSIPASITVAAAAKGPFVPPFDLLRSKGELGWKGSAATSAFRPAEPRKVLHLPVGSLNASPDESTSRPCRLPLDIDLNVPDETLIEELACRDSTAELGSMSDHLGNNQKSRNDFTGSAPVHSCGGLDLDLNRVDDANDMMQFPTSCSRRLEAPVVPLKSVSSSSLSGSEARRDFDLNNGPGVDDAGAEHSSLLLQGRSNYVLHPQASFVGTRPNSIDSGGFSAWFPPGNSYSSVTIPSVLPDRGEQAFPIMPPGMPQRILGPPGGNLFAPEIYRGSVLSSSPAVHFPSSPFPYQVFPFGTSMPLPSATFSVGSASYMDSTSAGRLFNPAVNSQFLTPVGSVTSQYPRPFLVNLSDGVTKGSADHSRKWGRPGLDLNAGPGSLEVQGRELLSQRQLLAASSQMAEEQSRIYSADGNVLKRKEPEGGWDSESLRYKQPSWQF
ncbi:hypothetical protein M9H77_04733 [Catharanthus roseus]|uniref:Uncharacterized protein n=1 Tax=Catharanthus roseus TaxID=4058 RepID=A0ACC0CF34_CATRO|nr:hypothetical protein M9H77_04733 [Catharanthus roseus]